MIPKYAVFILLIYVSVSCNLEPEPPSYIEGNLDLSVTGDSMFDVRGKNCHIKYVYDSSFAVYFWDSSGYVNAGIDVSGWRPQLVDKYVSLDSIYNPQATDPYYLSNFFIDKRASLSSSGLLKIHKFTKQVIVLELKNHTVLDTSQDRELIFNGTIEAFKSD